MLKNLFPDKGLTKYLLRLSAPIMLQNVINQSLALLDTFMVGALGEKELSAIALANTWFFVLGMFTFGVQSGMTVLVGQYWGKGDTVTINKLLGIGFVLSGSVTLVVAGVIAAFPTAAMGLTTNNPELAAIAADYARIVAFSYILNAITMIYLGAQRAMENPKFGMRVLIISMTTNTILNYVFIFGFGPIPAMGVSGAALATLISRVVEFIITFTFAAKNERLPLNFKVMFKPGKELIRDFTRYSLPVIGNETFWGFGFSMYKVILGHMPDSTAGLAAYTIAGTVESMVSAFTFGLGHGSAIIIGKELGSGKTEGMYERGKTLAAMNTVLGVLMGVLLFAATKLLVAPFLFPLFKTTAETAALTHTMLLMTCFAMPARALNFTIIVGILRGGGDTRFAMFIDIVSMYCLGVPIAALFGLVLGWGSLSVYFILCFEEVWKMIASTWRFRKRIWVKDVTRQLPADG